METLEGYVTYRLWFFLVISRYFFLDLMFK